MAEPLTRQEAEDGPVHQAAQRLERALARLEQGLHAPPPVVAPERTEALVVELDAARRRQRELAAAAAGASHALGQAMAEVRRTLDEDAERQGLFDFAGPDPLEIPPAPSEAPSSDEAPPQEEPAA